jgi:superfamily II DNA helicase RecQ
LISVTADKYRTLSLTTLGREVMAGRVEDVRMNVPRDFSSGGSRRRRRARTRKLSPTTADQQPDTRIVETLRAWRLSEARSRGIAPFVILHDRTLMTIAALLPDSAEALAEVPGIGPAKIAAYGDAILTLVRSMSMAP